MRRSLLIMMLLASLAAAPNAAPADETGPVALSVHWLDTRPDDSVLLPGLVTIFHAGDVVLYDFGKPASDILIEHVHGGTSSVRLDQLVESLRERFPNAIVDGFRSAPWLAPSPPDDSWPHHEHVRVELDPRQHRFLSWFGSVHPSDDAFVGNDDPMRIELFDADGRFKGPLYIDLFGNQVMDAGVCYNDEQRLFWLHEAPQWPRPGSCRASEGAVRQHPGLNGSLRNPDADPGVLGTSVEHPGFPFGVLRFDPVGADFSRPGFRFGRLVVTRAGGFSGEASGSWYSPERAGEGFNLELLEPHAPGGPMRILVHWFTYDASGGGRQVWLAGLGEFGSDQSAVVELVITDGGRFASTDNPATVQRRRWGELEIVNLGCNHGSVRYRPDDVGVAAGEFQIHRLSPAIEGLAWRCRP